MLDGGQRLITDFGHRNRDETDVIMTKIRDMNFHASPPGRWSRPGGSCADHNAPSLEGLIRRGHSAINVLTSDQEGIARRSATAPSWRGRAGHGHGGGR